VAVCIVVGITPGLWLPAEQIASDVAVPILIQVPVMPAVVALVNRSRGWCEAGARRRPRSPTPTSAPRASSCWFIRSPTRFLLPVQLVCSHRTGSELRYAYVREDTQ